MKTGDVIDNKYRIEALLGEGGMGRVMAATHVELGSNVAIKVLKADALSHAEVPARFMREARAAGRLRNEHVVRVVDVGRLATGEPFMVMEMLHGHDLATRLKKGALEPARAVEYIVQACEGLAEAHALGIIHRDIKPANLFVTERPNGSPLVKVLDFGIATAAIGHTDHRLTSTQSVIGSPSYMSPEQLRATRDVDARSDIWSLGITLYELLADRQPFIAPTITALSLKIVSDPHPPIDNIPDELMAIVDRCLEKDREARFANVAELAGALAPLFPNGRIAAEMVSGALSQPVPPTLMDASQPEVQDDPSQAGWQLPSSPNLTTTGFTAGESSSVDRIPAARSKKGWWIALGAVAMAGVGAAAVLGIGSMMSSSTAPHATAAKPLVQPAVAAPPAPTPPPPVVEAPPPPPVVEAVPEPVPEPVVQKPVKKPKKAKKPVKPPALVTQPEPVKEPIKEPTPQPSPTKPPQPCLPSDKTCGL